jgi:hypothetical protein
MRVSIWHHGTIGDSCPDRTVTVAKKNLRRSPTSLSLRKPQTHGGQTELTTKCPKCHRYHTARDPETGKALT